MNAPEQQTAHAFSVQSEIFDSLYGKDEMIAYKRERVRAHVLRYLPASSRILELNCGTGEDAVFFAGLGHSVHATDISEGMLQKLGEKVKKAGLEERISTEQCSFSGLQALRDQGPYDLVFSNFGGLNCTGNIGEVLRSAGELLRPGGLLTIVVISKFCMWELMLLFKGRWKTALRRFFASRGRKANIEGHTITCWYYSAREVRQMMHDFKPVSEEALCTLLPPSYIEGFPVKHPRLYDFLSRREDRLRTKWPWKHWGDYFILTLKK